MQRLKGSKQVRRHRKQKSFPSDSGSCGSGVADEDANSLQLGWRSSKQQLGTPMKKLLAAEMSRETESKRRAPSVIARLMGLDGLPLQLPKQHTSSSENHLKGSTQVGKTRSSGTLYDGRSSRRSSKDQQEFKDVFEVSEIPKAQSSSRYASQGPVDLKISDDEMSFIEQKFMDTKRLATYQDLQSSQDSHDTLEILDSNNDLLQKRHAMHISPKSSKIQFKGREEPDAAPTRIVVLKPNIGKVQNATKFVSSPCSSHTFLSEFGEHAEFSDIRFRDNELNQKKNFPGTASARHSRQNSWESREIAKEITSQMKNSLNNSSMIFSSSRLRGYSWDGSSCSFSGNESPEESEVTTAILENSLDISNTLRPSSHCGESSVSREAKKRLSERWKMSHKSQQGQSICRSNTLAEMLAIPDKEMKAANFDSTSRGKVFHDKVASSGKPAGLTEPVGISSRDGWKDGFIGSLPRSKSLPASSTVFGSPRAILRHEALRDDRFMMPKEIFKWERKKVVKCLDQRRCVNNRSLKSGRRKSRSSYSPDIEDDESSSPDLNTIQNKVKINLEEDSPKQEVLPPESLTEFLRDTSVVTVDAVDVANENAAGLSESSNKVLPGLSSCVLTKGDTNAVDKDIMQQELSVGSSSRNPVSPIPGLDSSCCKDADQPSPVSVLEPSFTDDLSSCSECFESLSVDLQGLRMQLQLLKLESEEYVEGSMLISSDEDCGEASTGILEDNGLCRNEDNWESSYMIDVLSESGIDRAQPEAFLEVWHSPECPVSLSVFDELEKRYSDWTTCTRSQRRLLFDRINSGIVNVREQFMSAQPWDAGEPRKSKGYCSGEGAGEPIAVVELKR
ncbi:DUF3741-associated sequence motif [Sesbania bispinosa]|nr:DUF3741-associated sequence motif [Sesbania bispinosa]